MNGLYRDPRKHPPAAGTNEAFRRTLARRAGVSVEQIRDFEDAHAEGCHDEIPREFCPECERQGRRA